MARALGVDISFTGDKALMRTFKRLEAKIQKKIARKALREAGKIVLAKAKVKCPVDTGFLRDNLKVRAEKKRNQDMIGITVATGAIKKKKKGKENLEFDPRQIALARYVAYVELGTKKMAARPFLRPAAEESEAQVNRKMAQVIKDGIFKETGKKA